MLSAIINPSQILDSYRKSDAVLIVCQNNTKKMIEIAALNQEAAGVLGYSNEAIVGKPLSDILPERINALLAEFMDYADEHADLLTVLTKVRDFSVTSSDGRELQFKLRVIRGESIDRNPWFHLVLVDEEKLRKADLFRSMLKENFKGHEVMDERTGLPSRASIIKDMELVGYYVREKQLAASFAVIDINHYENLLKEHSSETCLRLHQLIGQICKLRLRGEDTVGTLSERSLAIILVDAAQEPARMVLNRLRWVIGVSPLELPKKTDLLAQVNIGFSQIDGRMSATEILEKCEAFSIEQRKQNSNSVQLVVTQERRAEQKTNDRRKQNVPIAIERRKSDRRKS